MPRESPSRVLNPRRRAAGIGHQVLHITCKKRNIAGSIRRCTAPQAGGPDDYLIGIGVQESRASSTGRLKHGRTLTGLPPRLACSKYLKLLGRARASPPAGR
jgi:hypothetical protein